jgi:hypothetical protein
VIDLLGVFSSVAFFVVDLLGVVSSVVFFVVDLLGGGFLDGLLCG